MPGGRYHLFVLGGWGGDGVLLGARVDGLFFFEDVEFVIGSSLGCDESWAECVGEPMDVAA
jgi:hypothetical protein